MARPCGDCGNFRPGEPYTADQCRLCWLYHHDPAYRALWGGPAAPAAPRPPCQHRGPVRREARCPSCRGRVEVKVFACAVHGECTPARAAPGLACCAACADYEPAPPAPSGQP